MNIDEVSSIMDEFERHLHRNSLGVYSEKAATTLRRIMRIAKGHSKLALLGTCDTIAQSITNGAVLFAPENSVLAMKDFSDGLRLVKWKASVVGAYRTFIVGRMVCLPLVHTLKQFREYVSSDIAHSGGSVVTVKESKAAADSVPLGDVLRNACWHAVESAIGCSLLAKRHPSLQKESATVEGLCEAAAGIDDSDLRQTILDALRIKCIVDRDDTHTSVLDKLGAASSDELYGWEADPITTAYRKTLLIGAYMKLASLETDSLSLGASSGVEVAGETMAYAKKAFEQMKPSCALFSSSAVADRAATAEKSFYDWSDFIDFLRGEAGKPDAPTGSADTVDELERKCVVREKELRDSVRAKTEESRVSTMEEISASLKEIESTFDEANRP